MSTLPQIFKLNNYIFYFFIRPPPLLKYFFTVYYISKEILSWTNILILIGK